MTNWLLQKAFAYVSDMEGTFPKITRRPCTATLGKFPREFRRAFGCPKKHLQNMRSPKPASGLRWNMVCGINEPLLLCRYLSEVVVSPRLSSTPAPTGPQQKPHDKYRGAEVPILAVDLPRLLVHMSKAARIQNLDSHHYHSDSFSSKT